MPARVWSYTLGGYQVVKKWLSYREKALLGRGLTGEEATEVMEHGAAASPPYCCCTRPSTPTTGR